MITFSEEEEEAEEWIFFGVEDCVNEYLLTLAINNNREKIVMWKEKEMVKFITNEEAIYVMIEHPNEDSKNDVD